MKHWKRTSATIVGASLLVASLAGSAVADDIYIDVSTDPNARAIEFDLIDGAGQQQTVRFDYTEMNEIGGAKGCNLAGGPDTYVEFPVIVSPVAPTPSSFVSLDKSAIRFDDCNDFDTVTVTAVSVGSASVSLGSPTFVGKAGSAWDVTDAGFIVTVLDSTPVSTLDAPEIANAYLMTRESNADCMDKLGSLKSKKANWHGVLLSNVAKKFQGQTFTASTKGIVEDYVETACTTGAL